MNFLKKNKKIDLTDGTIDHITKITRLRAFKLYQLGEVILVHEKNTPSYYLDNYYLLDPILEREEGFSEWRNLAFQYNEDLSYYIFSNSRYNN